MKRPYCTYLGNDSNCENCFLSNLGMDCNNNPVNKLAYLRKKAGLTQTELANAIEIDSQDYISRLERGVRSINDISAKKAFLLAKALGITVEELLNI